MSYELTLLIVMGINIILALSLNLITGFCGQISLGHAAFYGSGAYAAALYATAGGPFWGSLPLAALVAAIFGFVVGFASLRVRDDFLAITTMGVGFLFIGVVRQQEVLGGEIGIVGIPDHGLGKPAFTAVVVLAAVLVTALSIYVKKSWAGFAFKGIAADEEAARAVGIDVARYKLIAFSLGTACAGLAGALYAYDTKYVGVDSFGFVESISILVMVIVGGIGSVWGVAIAAAILSVLPLWLQFIADYKLLLYGALLFVMMRFAPGGLDGLLRAAFSNARAPAPAAKEKVVVAASAPSRSCGGADMESARAELQVDDVSVVFGGVRAVDGTSLVIRPKELVGIIGPNGAGKTTLFKVIVGSIRPGAGRVIFRGRDITHLGMHERAQIGIGLSHQIVRPFRNMTSIENVTLAAGRTTTRQPLLSLFKVDRQPARSRALELLDLVGMAELAESDVNGLPLGYLKRLEVARALALEPAVVLLDEPLAGLNQQEAVRMASTIERINATGISIVLIEHNLREVMRISQRVVVLDAGRVLAEGNPADVVKNPQVRDAYMGTGSERAHAAA